MESPGGVALLSGFGSPARDSLEVGGWMVFPGGNNSTNLGLNQSLPWGVGAGGVDGNLSLGSSQAEAVIRAPTMKEKNWPALLILVIIVLTVCGNILVILAVSLEKKLQNATNFFLRSLAVADILVGILVMPVSLINILYDYAWPLPSALCPIWIYLDVLFSTASIMHLCAISLDRYVAIRNPIEHSRFNSRTKAMMKIAAVWTISIGVSMPIPVIGLRNKDKVFVDGSCVLNEEHFMLIGSFVAFFIPLVIMVASYYLTVQVLQRQATVFLYEGKTPSHQPLHPPPTPSYPRSPAPNFQVPPINIEAPPPSRQGSLSCQKGAEHVRQTSLLNTSPSEDISIIPSSEVASQLSSPAGHDPRDSIGRRGMMQAIKNERRASKVLGIVFFLFLIMWCPFFITNVTYVLCQGSCNEPLLAELLNVFVWVGYISSGVNPLVYTLFNKTYRRAFSSYIRCQYNTGPNAGVSNKSLAVTMMPCPSHAIVPIFGNGKMGSVDRNSNCRNGGGGNRADGNGMIRGMEPVDPTDGRMGMEMECPGIMSGLKPGMSELKLSVDSFCQAQVERTSSV
ncbi:5-hydroxytryptamine receptor 2C [Oncorhynchus keta]|uniref:5-hydroxytryptamine receptor 2C n=1 Tax=Oncorhynchus keta TaxID=8018 RepID=UPI0015FB4E2E|nr:5-hydroxytryptamine receptor 2C [Oncorhynchus keta]XP_035639882.1 5-hydroxytryptamine receptor 2C [Oncorhynchus keta]XP_035639884.1 5-hydroxytryptamine receptor 2C [Oncorhynchus keta]XP_035639885.1 5-hydroxytryptamine receptor 2C [Oncorhynchus keta]